MRGGKINSIECKEQSGIKHYFIINNLKKLKSLMEKEVLAEEIFDKMVIEIFKAADIKFDDFIKNNKIVGTGFFQGGNLCYLDDEYLSKISLVNQLRLIHSCWQ